MTLNVPESLHDDIVHDAKLDYYSKKLATCSSDNMIRIFNVNISTGQQQSNVVLIDTLNGHDGPVWQIDWAHPRFGVILASCSYDGKVIIWRENSQSHWETIKKHAIHNSSVNAIAWAPEEAGLILACGSSDGHISILSFKNEGWHSIIFSAHHMGCTSVAWRPVLDDFIDSNKFFNDTTTQSTESFQFMDSLRLASGGCDGLIKLWRYDTLNQQQWNQDGPDLQGHFDWVRDISWAPTTIGLPISMFASGGQDKRVLIWTGIQSGENSSFEYTCTAQLPPLIDEQDEPTFSDVVWKVNWSPMGLTLAISYGDNRVCLWKETVQGKWECIQDIQDGECIGETKFY